jgi:hypothetical protein
MFCACATKCQLTAEAAHNCGSRAPYPAPPSPSVKWPGYRHAPTGAAKVSILVPGEHGGGDHWSGMPAKPGSPPVTSGAHGERRASQGRTNDWPRNLRAEELLSGLSTTYPDPEDIATAQVHATLALAAATALSSDFRSHTETGAWRQAAGTSTT